MDDTPSDPRQIAGSDAGEDGFDDVVLARVDRPPIRRSVKASDHQRGTPTAVIGQSGGT